MSALDVPVVDQHGRKLHFYSDLVKDRTVAINFVFTNCSTICQPLTASFRKVQTLAAAQHTPVQLISISVDPLADTPDVLREFSGRFKAGAGWSFLTGAKADIDRLLRGLGQAAGAKEQHSSRALVGNDTAHRWTTTDGFAAPAIAALLAEAEKSRREALGREIFRGAGDGIAGVLEGSGAELTGAAAACSHCHGSSGRGTAEGGVPAPALRWQALMNPTARPAYDDGALARAIAAGQSSSGRPLHVVMPRYRMTASQMRDLIAYLHVLDSSHGDPGVAENTVVIGAALPLSGAMAPLGQDLRSAIEAGFADANERGGVFHRKIALLVEDSRGTVAGMAEANARLSAAGVFALSGSFAVPGSSAKDLEPNGETLVGPVGFVPAEVRGGVFPLLSSFASQAEVLVDVALHEYKLGSLALLATNAPLAREAADAARQRLRAQGFPAVLDVALGDVKLAASRLPEAGADGVLIFGAGDEVETLARLTSLPLFTIALAAGRGVFELDAETARRVVAAHPALTEDSRELARMAETIEKRGGKVRFPALQAVAFAAARVTAEALSRAGFELDRPGFLAALRTLRDFPAGPLPAVSLGSRQEGAVLALIDTAARRFVPLGSWRNPEVLMEKDH
jgi:ABC-type branched-subunit amino acid transport system substrate-binding protein